MNGYIILSGEDIPINIGSLSLTKIEADICGGVGWLLTGIDDEVFRYVPKPPLVVRVDGQGDPDPSIFTKSMPGDGIAEMIDLSAAGNDATSRLMLHNSIKAMIIEVKG